MAAFTVDWEPFFCFKKYSNYWESTDPEVDEPTLYLLDLLRRHDIKAIFYCLGWLIDAKKDLFNKIAEDGHIIGDHTYYHEYSGEHDGTKPFRSPRWKGEKRLYSGGFWFRAMPYSWVKKETEKNGVFFIHPHDILMSHPDCGNKVKTFERRIGLKDSRDKLERLCREVKWDG